jgi:hypothetical protein
MNPYWFNGFNPFMPLSPPPRPVFTEIVPPPFADDVRDEDIGLYPRDEIIAARASLIHDVQDQSTMFWIGTKRKLGIMQDGSRVVAPEPEHVWIPQNIPPGWSAPVVLIDPSSVEEGEIISDSDDNGDDVKIVNEEPSFYDDDVQFVSEEASYGNSDFTNSGYTNFELPWGQQSRATPLNSQRMSEGSVLYSWDAPSTSTSNKGSFPSTIVIDADPGLVEESLDSTLCEQEQDSCSSVTDRHKDSDKQRQEQDSCSSVTDRHKDSDKQRQEQDSCSSVTDRHKDSDKQRQEQDSWVAWVTGSIADGSKDNAIHRQEQDSYGSVSDSHKDSTSHRQEQNSCGSVSVTDSHKARGEVDPTLSAVAECVPESSASKQLSKTSELSVTAVSSLTQNTIISSSVTHTTASTNPSSDHVPQTIVTPESAAQTNTESKPTAQTSDSSASVSISQTSQLSSDSSKPKQENLATSASSPFLTLTPAHTNLASTSKVIPWGSGALGHFSQHSYNSSDANKALVQDSGRSASEKSLSFPDLSEPSTPRSPSSDAECDVESSAANEETAHIDKKTRSKEGNVHEKSDVKDGGNGGKSQFKDASMCATVNSDLNRGKVQKLHTEKTSAASTTNNAALFSDGDQLKSKPKGRSEMAPATSDSNVVLFSDNSSSSASSSSSSSVSGSESAKTKSLKRKKKESGKSRGSATTKSTRKNSERKEKMSGYREGSSSVNCEGKRRQKTKKSDSGSDSSCDGSESCYVVEDAKNSNVNSPHSTAKQNPNRSLPMGNRSIHSPDSVVVITTSDTELEEGEVLSDDDNDDDNKSSESRSSNHGNNDKPYTNRFSQWVEGSGFMKEVFDEDGRRYLNEHFNEHGKRRHKRKRSDDDNDEEEEGESSSLISDQTRSEKIKNIPQELCWVSDKYRMEKEQSGGGSCPPLALDKEKVAEKLKQIELSKARLAKMAEEVERMKEQRREKRRKLSVETAPSQNSSS